MQLGSERASVPVARRALFALMFISTVAVAIISRRLKGSLRSLSISTESVLILTKYLASLEVEG